MPRLHPLLLLALAAAPCAFAQTPPAIENDQVRVVTAHDQPHVQHALHEHKFNRVMVYLNAGRQDIVTKDGHKTTLAFKAGDVKWSPAIGLHSSEVISNDPVRIVEIEVKKPADPSKSAATPLDPVKVSPAVYKVEFENPQVRVLRVKFPPHGSVPEHEHVLNRVVVYLTSQDSRITAADGKVEESKHTAGQVSWGGPAKHKEENLLDTPVEVIVVEFKS